MRWWDMRVMWALQVMSLRKWLPVTRRAAALASICLSPWQSFDQIRRRSEGSRTSNLGPPRWVYRLDIEVKLVYHKWLIRWVYCNFCRSFSQKFPCFFPTRTTAFDQLSMISEGLTKRQRGMPWSALTGAVLGP